MRMHLDARSVVGVVALALAALLTSPGVHWARADAGADALQSREPAQSVESVSSPLAFPTPSTALAGPTCSVEPRAQAALQIAAIMERIRRDSAARSGGAGGVQMLNARGYNYGPATSDSDPRTLRLEALRQR